MRVLRSPHSNVIQCPLTSILYSPLSAMKVMVPAALGGSIMRCSISVFSFTAPKISPPEMWLPTWS